MDSVKITIAPEDWGNLVTKYPAYAKRLKIGDFTAGTKNIDTDVKGIITKRKGSVLYNTTPLSNPIRDQYEAIFTDGARHLLVVEGGNLHYSTGDNIFTLVTAGYSPFGYFEFATTQNRIYFGNGIDSPQVYDRTTTYGGVSYTAPQTKVMGAQAPSSAPTAVVVAGGSVPVGSHTYKITFIYYDAEQSNGGPATGVVTTTLGNQTVNLSSIPIGGYGVVGRNIYRDDNDGNYVQVGTLLNNTATTFSDTVAAGTFPIPIDHFTPPNFSMITLWLDRLWVSRVSGDPYTLFFSDPGFPDIYPDTNFIICNQQDPIEATIVYFDRLIVFNKKSMGQILGTTKDTFRYADIQGSVGCVDNRSIQIRVVNGVPIIVWLSDRGFYSYDGNSVNYLSDPIEDQVNFNIQQSSQKQNKNTQSTQADFQGGTASTGIDLDSIPGSITTINPTKTWDDEGDWEGGSSLTNISTNDGTNTIKVPTRFTIPYYLQAAPSGTTSYGTFTNLTFGDDIEIIPPSTINFLEIGLSSHSTSTGANSFSATNDSSSPPVLGSHWVSRFIVPDRAGNLTNIRIRIRDVVNDANPFNMGTFIVYTDLFGTPNVSIFDGGSWTMPNLSSGTTIDSGVISVPLAANTTYWIGFKNTLSTAQPLYNGSGNPVAPNGIKRKSGASWINEAPGNYMNMSFSYCANPVSKTGQWTGPVHDSFSDSVSTTLNIAHTGSYPTTSTCSGSTITGASTTVEGSNSPTFNITEDGSPVSESVANLNGNQNLSISGKRYWRVKIVLTTNDDRIVPQAGVPTLTFSVTGIWISETIDASDDVTDFTALDSITSVPSGTSIIFEVATSANDITYPDGFVAFGTEVVRRYIKVRVTLTTNGINSVTPSVSSLTLKWTITSTLTSSIIDTGVAPPAGWDIFQSTFLLNGGSVTFEMRSASSALGIPAATFYPVTPGTFPTLVPVFQFTQWRVTLISTANQLPKIDDVTISWFVELTNSVRVSSLFYNGRYYLSAAEFSEEVNNIIFVLDLDSKWRVYRGLAIATFSYFLNLPYWGSATEGSIFRFLEGANDNGISIALEIHTKAFDYSTGYKDNSDMVKVPIDLTLQGKNTGAAFEISYSVDEGQTFLPMYLNNGSTIFTSSLANTNFYAYFRAASDEGQGRTVMYRITSDDDNLVEIHSMKVSSLIRTQLPIITG